MTDRIQRELFIPRSPGVVWKAIASSASLALWMYPNDFEPRVGHWFTFQVPGNPQAGFDGLTVRCEVLACDPTRLLVFSWAAGVLEGTQVTFRLEPEGSGTRVFFEHAGFDVTQKFGKQAFHGASYGWTMMLGKLSDIASDMVSDTN